MDSPAPRGGHEQLRALVDIDSRSIGEAQYRLRARPRADAFLVADGGARLDRTSGQAVQTAPGGYDRRSRSAWGHPAVDRVPADIEG
jgi:hypothetical protein